MGDYVTKIGPAGRLLIPAEVRRALSMEPGTEVVLRVDEDGLRVQSRQRAIAHAQALVRRHVQGNRKLARELIGERRRDARR